MSNPVSSGYSGSLGAGIGSFDPFSFLEADYQGSASTSGLSSSSSKPSPGGLEKTSEGFEDGSFMSEVSASVGSGSGLFGPYASASTPCLATVLSSRSPDQLAIQAHLTPLFFSMEPSRFKKRKTGVDSSSIPSLDQANIIANLSQEVETLKLKLGGKDREFAMLHREHTAGLKSAQTEIARLTKEIGQYVKQIEELQKRKKELEDINRTLNTSVINLIAEQTVKKAVFDAGAQRVLQLIKDSQAKENEQGIEIERLRQLDLKQKKELESLGSELSQLNTKLVGLEKKNADLLKTECAVRSELIQKCNAVLQLQGRFDKVLKSKKEVGAELALIAEKLSKE